MANKTVDEFLMNAKSIQFIKAEDNNGIPAVFVEFEDVNTGIALYTEVVRLSGIYPQYLGFKKSHSSMILSFIVKQTNKAHAKMLLDYNEKEFDSFIKSVKPNDRYLILFGKVAEDGGRIIGGFQEYPVMFDQYVVE